MDKDQTGILSSILEANSLQNEVIFNKTLDVKEETIPDPDKEIEVVKPTTKEAKTMESIEAMKTKEVD
jgi:hypothetical protein